jgi:hypothetical protein
MQLAHRTAYCLGDQHHRSGRQARPHAAAPADLSRGEIDPFRCPVIVPDRTPMRTADPLKPRTGQTCSCDVSDIRPLRARALLSAEGMDHRPGRLDGLMPRANSRTRPNDGGPAPGEIERHRRLWPVDLHFCLVAEGGAGASWIGANPRPPLWTRRATPTRSSASFSSAKKQKAYSAEPSAGAGRPPRFVRFLQPQAADPSQRTHRRAPRHRGLPSRLPKLMHTHGRRASTSVTPVDLAAAIAQERPSAPIPPDARHRKARATDARGRLAPSRRRGGRRVLRLAWEPSVAPIPDLKKMQSAST